MPFDGAVSSGRSRRGDGDRRRAFLAVALEDLDGAPPSIAAGERIGPAHVIAVEAAADQVRVLIAAEPGAAFAAYTAVRERAQARTATVTPLRRSAPRATARIAAFDRT
ncbi:MAG: hypothetical protein AAGC56_05160 [Pseudomonadota bacterium]